MVQWVSYHVCRVRRLQFVCGSVMKRLLLLILFLCLTACSVPGTEQPATPEDVGNRANAPESAVSGFFEDLEAALKDPGLVREEVRDRWVERLAAYFAPNERDDQRILLNESLASFAGDRAQLAEDETMSIEISFDTPRSISIEGDRALVELPNAMIYMEIARLTERGAVPIYEQPIELGRVIGRTDGAVPTVRIGGYWYLTEG